MGSCTQGSIFDDNDFFKKTKEDDATSGADAIKKFTPSLGIPSLGV